MPWRQISHSSSAATMDAIRSSRKRNHPSSSPPHPLSGTFTRSKSQLFLHRNRSGQFRSDTGRIHEPYVRTRRPESPSMSCGIDMKQRSSDNDGDIDDDDDDIVLIKDLCKKPKLNREALTCDGEDPSRLLIKDLRARRVYSPQSSARACSDLIKIAFPEGNGVVDSDCRDQKIADFGFDSSFSVEKENSGSEREGLKAKGESDRGSDVNVDDVISTRIVASESPDFDLGNTELSCESNKLQDHKQCDGKHGEVFSEKIRVLNEELVLTTLPDAGICDNSVDNGDEGRRAEKVRSEDTPLAGNDEKNTGEGLCPKDDSQRNDSVLKSKSVLRSRSQEKLFKAPSSVNYRRLFPFLMEIMGDDFGKPKLGYCRKNEKGINSGQEFQLPLSSQSQEGSKCELKSDSCTIRDASQLAASEGDAVIAYVNELSYGNWSKLTSSDCLSELPMQLDTKEVTSECPSMPSVKDTCLSESKANPTADFHCVEDVGIALHDDDFKQDSDHGNNLDYTEATNHGGCSSEQFGVLNEECVLTTPPDVVIYDNPVVNVSQLESMPQDLYHVKRVGLTRTPQENAGEGFCLKNDKRKDSVLKSKSVPRPNLHSMRKLFKTPGSVSYRRMLPFLRDLTTDDHVTSKFSHQTLHQKDEADILSAKRSELSLWSQSQEASIDEHKTESGPMHGPVKRNALGNNILVDPANELSHDNQPQLTSSQGLTESPMQLDAEVVHKCSITLSVDENIGKVEIGSKDKCLTDSKFDLCSVMADSHSGKNVTNAVHNDGFKQVRDKISIEHNNESPHKAQNLLYVNCDVPRVSFEHHSSKENETAIDYDKRKQSVSVEQSESVSRYAPEVQNPNHLDSNMVDAKEKEASSHEISRSEDAVVLNHVSVVSNEEPRPPSKKIMLEKSDVPRHSGDKAESILNGVVLSPSMPSKGGSNKSATCVGKIGNGYESKTPLVLNRCSQIKLFRHAGSFSFRRLLPFLSNTMEDNSRASLIGHYPKLQKCLDQTPLLPISASDLRVIPLSDSNGCVPMEHCRGSSGTEQQTGLHAYDLNDDRSSPRSRIPESQSPHDSCKVIKLQDEPVELNGCCNLESSPNLPISVHSIDLPITPLGPIINGVITRDEEAASALPESSIYSEVKRSFLISSNGEKPPETHGCCHSLSHEKVLEQVRVPAVGFKKGILKRNPRGCRGLCTCLNCASFRLHAERAFEFSRNQLLDAEEVALDLIKELTHLRNMLERSADRGNDNPVFDGSQVEEACSKAFATEQLAKDRLSQMNDELNIHCRIASLQRPRVKFADNVEEKVIQPGR